VGEKVARVEKIIKWSLAGILLAIVLVITLALILKGYSYEWVGFGVNSGPSDELHRGKTLWDWMELLIIPIVLSVGALIFNRVLAANERRIASERAQDTALQSYLDSMTELLLEKQLRSSLVGSEVTDIARARTLTVLGALGGKRKGIVLRFLYEAGLVLKDNVVIDLTDADLSGAQLIGTDLRQVDLSRVSLYGANLRGSTLRDADLRWADLSWIDAEGTDFTGANLGRSNLTRSHLKKAKLQSVKFERANLFWASLRGSTLEGASFFSANLVRADLSETDVSMEQIDMAASVDNATLPDRFAA
jgi:uncharacterized protein YjbI with pentapeptide repeats